MSESSLLRLIHPAFSNSTNKGWDLRVGAWVASEYNLGTWVRYRWREHLGWWDGVLDFGVEKDGKTDEDEDKDNGKGIIVMRAKKSVDVI
jgi:hypothetical protein